MTNGLMDDKAGVENPVAGSPSVRRSSFSRPVAGIPGVGKTMVEQPMVEQPGGLIACPHGSIRWLMVQLLMQLTGRSLPKARDWSRSGRPIR